MKCPKTECEGYIEEGACNTCGSANLRAESDVPQSVEVKSAGVERKLAELPAAATEPSPARQPVAAQSPISNNGAEEKNANSENVTAPRAESASVTAPMYDKRRSAPQNLMKLSARLKAIDETSERGKDELLKAASVLETVSPDKFEAWRAQADLWMAAIRQLERRQLRPDDSVMLLGIPLNENQLRDAAEKALRHCAHLATSIEDRIALVDEANSVRKMTWF